jgi:hypothetical protein
MENLNGPIGKPIFQKLIQRNDRTHWDAQSTGVLLVGGAKKNSGRNRKLTGERNHESQKS